MRLRNLLTATLAATLLTSMAACGGSSSGDGSADPSQPLKVMADVIPHAELIREAETLGLLGDVNFYLSDLCGVVYVFKLWF